MALLKNKQAVGAYLRFLREKKNLRQEDMAAFIQRHTHNNTNIKQIYRWENGETMIPGDGLMAYLDVVDGDPCHVQRLILVLTQHKTVGSIWRVSAGTHSPCRQPWPILRLIASTSFPR